MKFVRPIKLGGKAQSDVMAPVTAALVAMRLGRATTEHYHNLAGAMTIAYRVAELVSRHKHLLDEIQPALDALNAIYARQAQRTIPDAPYSGTAEEIDDIEHGAEIYRAIIRTTPGPVMARAIQRELQNVRQQA